MNLSITKRRLEQLEECLGTREPQPRIRSLKVWCAREGGGSYLHSRFEANGVGTLVLVYSAGRQEGENNTLSSSKDATSQPAAPSA